MKKIVNIISYLIVLLIVFLLAVTFGMKNAYAYDNGKSIYEEQRYDYRTRRYINVDFNGGSGSLSHAVQVDRTSKGNVIEGMWIDGLGIGTLVKDVQEEYHYLRAWPNNQTPKEGRYWMEVDSIGVTPYLVFSDLKRTGYTYNGISTHLSNGKQYLGLIQSYKGSPACGIGAKATGWTMNKKSGNALRKWLKDNPDIYFKVLWKANTYTIKYNGNGETGGFTDDSVFTYDIKGNLNNNGYYKEGYIFMGWSTHKDGNVVFKDKQSVFNLTDQNEKTIELYARWQPVDYTNTIGHSVYDSNNKYIISLGTSSFTKKTGDIFTLNSSMSKKLPNGFYLDSSFKNVSNTIMNILPQTYTQPSSGLKFEFYYKPIKYSIHYELNGGINNPSNPLSYTIMDGYTLADPYKKGCKFLGWYIDGKKVNSINKKGFEKINSVSELYSLSDKRIYGDITIYAKWSTSKPTIDVKDCYYYKNENISNNQILKNVNAYDEYDGNISNKIVVEFYRYPNGNVVKNPTSLNTSNIGCINAMYSVVNSHGQTAKKEGKIYIVEKGSHTIEEISNPNIYSRFISMQECADGSVPLDNLSSRSIWNKPENFNILVNSLNKKGNDYLKNYDYINQSINIKKIKKVD